MEFGHFKIDFNGLAILISAITAAYATFQGNKQRKRNRDKKAELEHEKKEGDHNVSDAN